MCIHGIRAQIYMQCTRGMGKSSFRCASLTVVAWTVSAQTETQIDRTHASNCRWLGVFPAAQFRCEFGACCWQHRQQHAPKPASLMRRGLWSLLNRKFLDLSNLFWHSRHARLRNPFTWQYPMESNCILQVISQMPAVFIPIHRRNLASQNHRKNLIENLNNRWMTIGYNGNTMSVIFVIDKSCLSTTETVETVETWPRASGIRQAAFTASLYAGSLGGISLGLLLVALASLPLCCGVLKEHSKAGLAVAETGREGRKRLLCPGF